MKICYHLTVLPPKMPETEALSQEISTLRCYFDGHLTYLNPNISSPVYLPRILFGFHKLRYIRSLEKEIDIHQVYNPDPFPFPILKWLRPPVIYSITSGVGQKKPNIRFLSSLTAVAVPDERSLARLRGWGLKNVFLTRPGIDTTRFSHTSIPLDSEFRLLIGSAPWTKAQFRTKGVTALLEIAQRNPEIQLIFLWRGVLVDEMQRLVKRLNLDSQITILNEQVDVNQILAGVHATIALATSPGIVKSYPHSLLDSLAAGKPVLVSRAIPMSDYVERMGCGRVIEAVDPQSIGRAIRELHLEYRQLENSARQCGPRDFSEAAMIAGFRAVYDHVLQRPHEPTAIW